MASPLLDREDVMVFQWDIKIIVNVELLEGVKIQPASEYLVGAESNKKTIPVFHTWLVLSL